MIKDIRYKFDFEIKENNSNLTLVPKIENYNIEQRKLFSAMLNFGYTEFAQGDFYISSSEIVDFWNYSKNSILKNYSIEKYYALLGFEKPYTERIPGIKTEGSFYSNEFKMKVVWVKTVSKMITTPIAYKQDGIRLKDLDFDEVLGSLSPEYFELYSKIDNANSIWGKWNTNQRYEFLTEIENLSKKSEISIPQNLSELLSTHKKMLKCSKNNLIFNSDVII